MIFAPAPGNRPSWLAGALSGAVPPPLPTLVGMLLWGIVMGASALMALVLADWETPQKIRTVTALFALGGAAAYPLGLILARFLSYRRRRETAFAAAFLSLAFATVGMTAGLFALQYRDYYAQWHSDTFTRIWFLQFAYTIAAALYQFSVLGLWLFFPLGFIALIAASLWFARRAR